MGEAYLGLGYAVIHVGILQGSPPAVFFSLQPDLSVIFIVRLLPAVGCAVLLSCRLQCYASGESFVNQNKITHHDAQ